MPALFAPTKIKERALNSALPAAYITLAQKLRESDEALSHEDIRRVLCDALEDEYPGRYCYVSQVYGDAESGDVVYCCGSDYYKAPYTIGGVAGKASVAEVDTDSAVEVSPRTVYDEMPDEDEVTASMEEALRERWYTAGDAPLCERFVSKGERAKMSPADFAGKGKSFPINKPGDVMAAVKSIGRAGPGNHPAETIKANIKRIAKRKGFPLPKSWQDGDDSKEALREAGRIIEAGARHSAADTKLIQDAHDKLVSLGADCSKMGDGKESTGLALAAGEIPLRESAAFCSGVTIRESVRESAAPASYPIRIITPGWGTSGYYSPALLERDGPKIFKAGTQCFWDHATEAEESARPEGRMDDLAAVTTKDAYWDPKGKDGAGLYAEAKVFGDYADKVAEKAKYTGLSIRAGGTGKEGTAEGRTGMIIESLTRAQSIDFVTRAGRGGKVLTEAARAAATITTQQEGESMTPAEQQEMQGMKAELKKLRERAALSDAATAIREHFADPAKRVGEAIQERVTGRVLARSVPLTEAGDLDRAKLTALIETEVKDECAYISRLSGRQVVVGMGGGASGGGAQPQLTEAQRAEIAAREADRRRQSASLAGFEITEHKMAASILERGRAAFDPNYNARVARGAKATAESAMTLEVGV